MTRKINQIITNELGLSDNVVGEERRVLLESKECRLPRNAEFLIVFWYVNGKLLRKRL